jgi:5-methylcytosine-specific restriction protein A
MEACCQRLCVLSPERFSFFQPKRSRQRPTKPSASKRGYGGKAWESLRLKVLLRDNWQCRACGRVCTDSKEAHCDHIVPKRLGGLDTMENLQCLCARCNAKKVHADARLQ